MVLSSMVEKSLYILPQKKSRALIPKTIILFILGIIFYLGILLNVALLAISAQAETTLKLISLIVLLIVVFTGIFLSFRRSRMNFIFYQRSIKFGKKEIFYRDILNTTMNKDFLDKMFGTYSINLGHDFHLKHISQEVNIENYLRQLINYSYGQGS